MARNVSVRDPGIPDDCAGTGNAPSQVRPDGPTPGSAVVTPDVEPGTYAKPTGRASVIWSTGAATTPGFWTVMV